MQESIGNPFKPDQAAELHYKKQLVSFIGHGSPKPALIDMGPLPPIYKALGIADKQLKTNGKTILKALGFEGKNKHVPQETLEGLLSLVYDPEAVLKSISKRHSYISVLSGKTENDEQVIAILSPSHNGQGFTFIPSVYEKHNFDRFFNKICNEQSVLYIKNKDSELWGRHQLPPRHNQKPYSINVLTKDYIVKRLNENTSLKEKAMNDVFPDNMSLSDDGKRVFVDMLNQIDGSFGWLPIEKVREHLQAQNPSLEGRDYNSKEKPMSDASENLPEEKNLSPRELAFQNTVYQRNMVGAALNNGTLCCLPGKDGYADTSPAMNFVNHNVYKGDTLLYLKGHQNKNGFPTGEYLAQAQIEKAREDVPGLFIKKGQKGVSIHVSEKNDETGEWDEKHIRLFNVAQLDYPAKFEPNFERWIENNRSPKSTQYSEGPEIVCASSDPVKYLGQYFAAVSKGVPFKADQETAKEFAKNMGDSLYAQGVKKDGELMKSPKTGEPVTDPFSLCKICREANKYSKEFIFDLNRQQNPEQKQEQKQTRKGPKL